MPATTKNKILILANFIALAVVLVVNYLAASLPIAGRTPADVSAQFPTLFTPAGFTFAIWGIIYLLLIGFAFFQFSFWRQENPQYLEKLGYLFILSCAANAGWLFAFHYLQIGLSMLLMLVLLGSLLVIYRRLEIGRSAQQGTVRWLGQLPFRVYLGWISVATIANASILLTHLGWEGQPPGPVFWTLLILTVAAAIALWMLFRNEDIPFVLVILWAFYGIYSARIAGQNSSEGMVATGARAGMLLLAAAVLFYLIKKGAEKLKQNKRA